MRMCDLGRKCKCEENRGKYLVDADAYVPTRIRVEQYLAAGRMLDEYNRNLDYEDFDSVEEAEDADVNIVRRPGFDPADVTYSEQKRSEKKLNSNIGDEQSTGVAERSKGATRVDDESASSDE